MEKFSDVGQTSPVQEALFGWVLFYLFILQIVKLTSFASNVSGLLEQEYVLRRDAVRVLTFLASSGDAAVRILLHAQIKWDQSVPFKESNSVEGGNALQSENPQEGSRITAGTGDVAAPTADREKCFDIPYKLISLLARELEAEEDEAANTNGATGCEEDRYLDSFSRKSPLPTLRS